MTHQRQGKVVWTSNPKLAVATSVANARHCSLSPPPAYAAELAEGGSSPPAKRARLGERDLPIAWTSTSDPSSSANTNTSSTSAPSSNLDISSTNTTANPTANTAANTTASTSTRTTAPSAPTLHAWLHPDEPPPLMTHSPPLHFSTSTFLAFSFSFLPSPYVTSEPLLAKQARRMVKDLDVCGMLGAQLFEADDGAFQGGEGRAPGKRGRGGEGRAREPDHRMWAVRTLCLKDGKNGTRGADDYQLLETSSDDGEKFGGERVLRVLKESQAVDVLTVCCRWFGGDMIGPIRFQHMATTSQTATAALIKLVNLRDLRQALEALDEDIAAMRATLRPDISSIPNTSLSGPDLASQDSNGASRHGALQPSNAASQNGGVSQQAKGEEAKPKTRPYDDIQDVGKLQRLLGARERTKASLESKVGWAAMEQAKAQAQAQQAEPT